jgi:prepilin peptidase CpaA
MMETQALMAATAAMAVLMGLAAWFDLKALRIPNWCVLAVVGVFIVTGLWGLPIDVFAWRFLHGVIVLFVGFALYSFSGGNIGGGDIKLIAALTPFIAGKDLLFVLLVFALLSFAGLMIHRLARALLRGRKTGWAAMDQKRFFPAGLLLGGTIMIYLGWQLAGAAWPAAA